MKERFVWIHNLVFSFHNYRTYRVKPTHQLSSDMRISRRRWMSKCGNYAESEIFYARYINFYHFIDDNKRDYEPAQK